MSIRQTSKCRHGPHARRPRSARCLRPYSRAAAGLAHAESRRRTFPFALASSRILLTLLLFDSSNTRRRPNDGKPGRTSYPVVTPLLRRRRRPSTRNGSCASSQSSMSCVPLSPGSMVAPLTLLFQSRLRQDIQQQQAELEIRKQEVTDLRKANATMEQDLRAIAASDHTEAIDFPSRRASRTVLSPPLAPPRSTWLLAHRL